MTSESARAERLPIDVIIPAWGDRYVELLPRALRSAASAACRTVVGDEHALAIAAEHGAERMLRLTARHPGAGRDVGLAASTAEYVLFLDADDELLPGALEAALDRLERHPRAVAAAGLLVRRPSGTFWPPLWKARIVCLPLGASLLLFQNVLPAVGAILIRRAGIRGGPLFPELEDEDWHAAIRIRLSGRVHMSAARMCWYSVDEGTISRRPRDPRALRRSRSALLPIAEDALGRRSVLFRCLEPWAARARDRGSARVTRTWGVTQGDRAE